MRCTNASWIGAVPAGVRNHWLKAALLLGMVVGLGGCASTVSVKVEPEITAPVCAKQATARIWWTTAWRPDQKDVPQREAAAATGFRNYFADSACFAQHQLAQAVSRETALGLSQQWLSESGSAATVALVVTVRELGPTVRIGGSWALVEGATEVVLDVDALQTGVQPRRFTVHWRDGGAGTIKGVATLPADLAAALAASLEGKR